MKFENVNIGDIVFIEKKIEISWDKAECFFVPEKVIRITKTQFVVECGDRYKKDGYKIGSCFDRAYNQGDKISMYSDRVAKDESEEMKSLVLKLNLEKRINRMAEKIDIPSDSKFSILELNDIADKLEYIYKLLETK